MKAEPLNINDKRFLINRLIEQAPVNTLIREFFKNADESAALAPEGSRLIEIYPVEIDGVRKLAFWNTGPGMDGTELKRATDLSSSIGKVMALDGNFGIGAKVSGLTMSKTGIRYRSCKNGSVSEVTIGYDEHEETYVRFPALLPDGSSDTVYDVTDAVLAEGKPTDLDWTEVVLFGESDDHDTVAEPLGKGKFVDRSFVPSAIFRRFAAFSDGVEVRIDVAMTKGGGKDETGRYRQLRPLADVLDRLPQTQRVHDQNTGLAIHYIHDPKHPLSSHTLSARANPATSSTTFCAVVHKGERYDFKNSKAWSAAAPKFGIPFGSKVLTIEIEIPNSMALPNQYRDGLLWPNDRSPLTADDFADYVRALMPEWVKEVIRAESPESDENLDDLQTDLQKLLDEFRVPTLAFSPSKNPNAVKMENYSEGNDTSQRLDADLDLPGDGELGGEQRIQPHSARAKADKVRKAPSGSKPSRALQALERVPDIKILVDPEEVAGKNLKGRAGRYYSESQTLFVNGLYPIVERMAAELEQDLAGTGEPEVVRAECLRAARRSAAFRVGKVTCYAISKRLSEDWSGDDLESATSPESLSMAADDYVQGLSVAKKWARDMIRAAKLESAEVA
ncbi:hypothetical protein [Mesorhizobium sp. CA12]|uniref:hypothetical protein n=1 Tax=Mesorhizobium sp. CA12 TaxID=2876644 RepID=UPI001CCC76DF|nr:hypothetical protein [Mesorhizobium sp. CA12]MBZ9860008.1 hypothetical protein [Mesorhizobium sp. CA12]